MPHALLLNGHADPTSFNHALAARYADGYRAAGGTVERIDLAELAFDPVLRHGYRAPQPLEPDLLRVRAAIERADHLAWVFPTYWASPPTVVRGLIDRLFLPGWAFKFEGHALPTGLLRGRSARIITTMDSPGWWYRFVLGRPIHATLGQATLRFCGIKPVEVTTIHGLRAMPAPTRARWCERVEHLATRDARQRRPRALPATTPSALER